VAQVLLAEVYAKLWKNKGIPQKLFQEAIKGAN